MQTPRRSTSPFIFSSLALATALSLAVSAAGCALATSDSQGADDAPASKSPAPEQLPPLSGEVVTACGDGIWDEGTKEVCDDGNARDGDGCSNDCSVARCLVPVTHASIQAGVDDASCATVYVSGGDYAETVNIARDITIHAVGAEPVRVDARQRGSVLRIAPAPSDDDAATQDGDDGAALSVHLLGLELTGGEAERGGGIYAQSAALILETTSVYGNTATQAGGGIYTEGGSLELAGAQVRDNRVSSSENAEPTRTAIAGGGVYFLGGGALTLRAARVLDNQVVLDGVASEGDLLARGGGIYSEAGTTQLLRGTVVAGNAVLISNSAASASAEAGGVFQHRGALNLAGASKIQGNIVQVSTVAEGVLQVTANGGGAVLEDAALYMDEGSEIADNSAQAEGPQYAEANGGGVYLDGSSPADEDIVMTLNMAASTLRDNRAAAVTLDTTQTSESHARGGALYARARYGQTLELALAPLSEVRGNVAEARGASPVNTVAQGGGIHLTADSFGVARLSALDSALSDNRALADDTAQGGALSLRANSSDAELDVAIDSSEFVANASLSDFGLAEGGAIWTAARGTDSFLRFDLLASTLRDNASLSAGGPGRGGAWSVIHESGDTDIRVELDGVSATGNHASARGGALDAGDLSRGGVVLISNSVLDNNEAPEGPDCATHQHGPPLHSQGNNHIGSLAGCSVEHAPGGGHAVALR
ncbi:hypothetical protein [Haliangium ochraceum]|uniref:Cysteine-rich repeat protein n=1 Tax=Haliangium ochraceum (strain DSM 14365 / JCM 11303 / SMP-2) TaxID=502025 RepID=D0LIK7_HALO1|nr:hypothetical protein [Haliangium ochraceum]ACY18363.1 cysteine-rich repeat protein [Haliangium ochraceum DSM 14365]